MREAGPLNMHQSVTRICLQRDPCNDIQGVNDIAKRFAHLPSMGIPYHCVQINLYKGDNISHVNANIMLSWQM